MQPVINEIPYEGDGRNRTDMTGNLQGTDLFLDAAVSYEGSLRPEIQSEGRQGSP